MVKGTYSGIAEESGAVDSNEAKAGDRMSAFIASAAEAIWIPGDVPSKSSSRRPASQGEVVLSGMKAVSLIKINTLSCESE